MGAAPYGAKAKGADRNKMGAAPYGAKAKGADAPARRLRDIRRVHSWARRYNTTERMKSFVRSMASATARRALWRESQGLGCARPAPEGH